MATTIDELLVRVTVDAESGVKGLKAAGTAVDVLSDAMKRGGKDAALFESKLGALGVKSSDLKRQFSGAATSIVPVGTQLKLLGKLSDDNVKVGGRLSAGIKGTGSSAASAAAGLRQYAQELAKADAAARPLYKTVTQLTGALNDVGKVNRLAPSSGADFAKNAANRFRAKPAVKTDDAGPKPADTKQVSTYAAALGKLGLTAVAVNQALDLLKKGFGAISSFLSSTVGAYVEAERADRTLTNTLKISGAQSEDAAQRFRDFAKAMQATTTTSDDTALSLLSVAKAAGITDDVAMQMVTTATDMAAVTGEVDQNFKQLLGSLKGEAGELANVDRSIRDMSEGALRGGAAIKQLSEKFKGLGAADAKSLGGALAQLSNETKSLLEEIGGAITDAFHVPSAIVTLRDAMHDVRDAVVAVRGVIDQFNNALKQIDWAELRKSLAIVTTLVVAFGVAWQGVKIVAIIQLLGGLSAAIAALGGLSGIITAVKALAVAWAEAGAAMVLATAEFLAIAVAVGAIATAIEFLIRNVDKLGEVFELIGRSVFLIANNMATTFVNVVAMLLTSLESALETVAGSSVDIGGVAEAALGKVRGALAANLKISESQNFIYQQQSRAILDLKKNLDFTTTLGQGYDFIKNMLDDTAKAKEESAKVKPPPADGWKRLLETVRQLTAETKQLQIQADAIGAGEVDQVKFTLAANLAQLDAKREELQVQGLISGAVSAQLDKQKELAKLTATKTIEQLRLDSLKELGRETVELNEQLNSQSKGQIGLIDAQTDAALRLLDIKAEELKRNDKLTTAAKAQIEEQRRLLKLQGEGAKKQARNVVSNDQKEGITEAFGAGAGKAADVIGGAVGAMAGPVGAIMGAADAVVGAVQSIIDFIPKIINAVANIFSSLGDLPKHIGEAFQNLLKGLVKFVADFIPGIITMIGTILDAIVQSFDKLPDAMISVFEKLPEMLDNLVKRLPDIVEKIVKGLIGSSFRIGAALIIALIKGVPRLAKSIVVELIPALVRGIIAGIVEGIQQASDAIAGIGSPKVDTSGVEKAFEDIGKQATGISESVFRVLDLKAEAKGMDLADKIRDAIDSATGRTKNIFDKIFAFLKMIWEGIFGALKAVWTGLIAAMQAFWDGLVELWRTTWDNIVTGFKDAFKILKAVWDFVYEQILKPLIEGVQAAFQWVLDNVVTPLVEGITSAFQWVQLNVINPFIEGIQGVGEKIKDGLSVLSAENITAAFQWVYDNIVKPLMPVGPDSLGAKSFDWVQKNIIDKLSLTGDMSLGASSFKWPKEKIIDALSLTGEGSLGQKSFKWVDEKILTPLKSIGSVGFQWVVDKVLTPLQTIGQTGFTWVNEKIITPLKTIGETGMKWVETNIVTPLKTIGETAFTWVQTNIVTPLKTIGSTAFTWVKTNVIDKLTNFSWPSFGSLPKFTWPTLSADTLKGYGDNILTGLTDGLTRNRDFVKGFGSSIWDGFAEALSKAVAWLKEVFASVVPSLGGGGGGGNGFIRDSLGMATGGLVRYAASGEFVNFKAKGTDTVPYMLTPGEFVVNAPAVRGVGRGFMEGLNRGEVPDRGDTNNRFDVNLTIRNEAPLDDDYVKRKLVPLFLKEIEFQSTHGRGIMSAKGLRK